MLKNMRFGLFWLASQLQGRSRLGFPVPLQSLSMQRVTRVSSGLLMGAPDQSILLLQRVGLDGSPASQAHFRSRLTNRS